MKSRVVAVISVVATTTAVAAERGESNVTDESAVYRRPFTLKVPIDRTHYYEERKGRLPYVYHGGVGLFIGDHFGLKIEVRDNNVRSIKYEPDLSKADVTLEFKQGPPVDDKATSLLIMQNRTKYTFLIDAGMQVPGRKDTLSTSLLPLGAGLSSFESWPHAIIGLGLDNFRVQK
jgi:hypothetical protein